MPPVDTWTVTFSPDSKQIVTGSHPGKVNFVGVESGKKEEALDTRSKFTMSIACVGSLPILYLLYLLCKLYTFIKELQETNEEKKAEKGGEEGQKL